MKFRVTMKNPDTLNDAIEEAVGKSVQGTDLAVEERAAVAEVRMGRVSELCNAWFAFGEYLTVEIDTEAKTCTVVPAEEFR